MSIQKVNGTHPAAKLDALVEGGEIQIHPVALDVAAAVLRYGDAVDIRAVVGDDEHPGAVGDVAGIYRHRALVDGGAGVGGHVAARVRVGVGRGADGGGIGISQHLAGGEGDVAVGNHRHFVGVGGFPLHAGAYGDDLRHRRSCDGLAEHRPMGKGNCYYSSFLYCID